jgi:Domain of unknown function (DUF5658)
VALRTYCWLGLVLYGALSAADLALTAALLRANGRAYESNPAAAACLERYGLRGLAVFKAAGLVAFAGAVFLLVRRRPPAAAGVVTFGCLVLLWVTTYSHGLLIQTHRENAEMGLSAGQPASIAAPVIDPGTGLPEDCWFPVR